MSHDASAVVKTVLTVALGQNITIAILVVQETHLDKTNTQQLHQAFGKRLKIYNSQLENRPGTSASVAFILNKNLIKTDQVATYELIKGKALAVKITSMDSEEMLIINVYAPNRRSNHQQFWKNIN
ncbi:hypothetical protein EI94DRAFT_1568448 [Lactarius quietus]|nr:hypothetical protein EI94DRAFT_1568448 [Lactarius quietus]